MDSSEMFDRLSLKMGQLLYRGTLAERNKTSQLLDELDALDYRSLIVKTPTKAVLLINQLCTAVDPEDELLVPKCVSIIVNLVTRQGVLVEGRTLTVSIQWCLQSLRSNNKSVILAALRALEALLRNNIQNSLALLESFIKVISTQINNTTQDDISQEILLASLRFLEASTVVPADYEDPDILFGHLEKCAMIFNQFLWLDKPPRETITSTRILETCLIGLQNIIVAHPEYLKRELGSILGIIKTFMLYSLRDIEFLPPEKLTPTTLSVPEVTFNAVKERTGGKMTKQRKHRGIKNKKRARNHEETSYQNNKSGYSPAKPFEYNSDTGCGSLINPRLKTSDSDFSDPEGGTQFKLYRSCNKVRQAALNLFAAAIKYTEKSTLFTYWPNFIPETSSPGKHNLITCVLHDTSTRGKMCALNALLLLLTSAKVYLLQAELSDKTSSFTPFSMAVGLTLIELHTVLCSALNQSSVPVLAQVLKCLAALVQATPYCRMPSGLITEILTNVKAVVYHREATVQVTALIVVGCILAFEPPLPEIVQAMIKIQPTELTMNKAQSHISSNEDFDYAQFSSDEEEPCYEVDSMPWILQRCLRNLEVDLQDSSCQPGRIVPAPVKLESLQILSPMSRNYFDSLVLPHLNYITKAIEMALKDKYLDLKLHAGRAVDFLGQAMGQKAESGTGVTLYVNFWLSLLNGPLVSLIQDEENAVLRATGCDCLGSIGPHIFEQFPRDKQILCVTLLFACAKDEEQTVRGAAVRALAICVLYPTLREDPGFVVDTAECILTALKDDNSLVRVKASWSLGNLSDALALNSNVCETPDDRVPSDVLLRLLKAGIKYANDNDKLKMNVVRALGNIIRLVDSNLIEQEQFRTAIEQALDVLVKASTTGPNMKIRWNACYALANALKNGHLYNQLDGKWQTNVFSKLTELVTDFKNFKVRINAALALSSPATREHYGQHFIPLWCSLLRALENSQEIDNFAEYKHRDNLIEQICLCLGHLTVLLTERDLAPLEGALNLYYDTLKTHMGRVLERLVPEKSTELFSADCVLAKLASGVVGSVERRVLERLRTVFASS